MTHRCVSLVPLFNHLEKNEQDIINQLAQKEEVKKGEILLSPYENEKLIIIAKGSIKLYQLNVNGKEQLLRVMSPGDFEGDQELLGTKNKNLYAEALKDSTICVLTKHDFQNMLLQQPQIALKLLELNAQKMHQVEKQAQFLATDSIEERLAAYLLDLSLVNNTITVELPFKMKELAAFIGTTPETLSRKLKNMEEKGWIKRKKRTITILKKEELEEI